MSDDKSFENSALEAFKQTTHLPVEIVTEDPEATLALYPVGGEPLFFSVRVYPDFTPGRLKELRSEPEVKSLKLVLITNYVNQAMAKMLRKNNIQFIDLAGNTYIQRSNFLIYVVGNSPPEFILTGEMSSFFTDSKLWVLLFILCTRGLVDRTMRDISEQSGVSHTTVSNVITYLKKTGFIVDRGRCGREIIQKEKLFELWAGVFNETVRPKVVLGRYSSSFLNWEHDATLPDGACWGGELAIIGQTVNKSCSGKIFIYTDKLPLETFKKYNIMPNPHGNIEVVKVTMNKKINVIKSGKVHPAFIFADLLSCDNEHCKDLAKEIFLQQLSN